MTRTTNKNVFGNRKAFAAITFGVLFSVAMAVIPNVISARSSVFADSNASGSMDGTAEYPFKKIQDAIDKAAKDHRNVIVRKGTYVENINVKENVEINGENQDKVVIIAKDKHDPTVTMEDGTELRKVTVKNGEYGVYVEKGAHAVVDKCTVTNNRKDGIKAGESNKKDKDHQLEVYNSEISDNGWNGIYAMERKSIIMDNDIGDNDKEGIELEKNSVSWVSGNSVHGNGNNGLRVTIDGSKVFTRNNTFNHNDGAGAEVRSNGKSGLVSLEKSKFYNNHRFGVARVSRGGFSAVSQWDKALFIKDAKFYNNNKGNVSPILNW